MKIKFYPFSKSHFSLVLKWLESPYVKKWWDKDVSYTMNSLTEKYSSYVENYKLVNGVPKDIFSFIISYDNIPIGYIQYYNLHDFYLGEELIKLPKSTAALDFYIGNEAYIGKGIGKIILSEFLNDYIFLKYQYVFVNLDINNFAAIKLYSKIGFKKIDINFNKLTIWMIKNKN